MKILFYITDFLFLLFMRRRLSSSSGMALVRLDAIGDFFLWLDAARAIRKTYPNTKITLIANTLWASMAHELIPVDEMIIVDRRSMSSFRKRYAFLKEMSARSFETVLAPAHSREWLVDMVVAALHSPDKRGWDGDSATLSPYLQRISNRFYTSLLPSTGVKMELIRNAEFIRWAIDPAYRAKVACIEMKQTKTFDVVLFPGASWEGKMWPLEKFADVARRLFLANPTWRFVIAGGPGEEKIGQRLSGLMRDIPHDNRVGKTSLRELLVLLSQAHALISNDTGAAHMAASVGTRTVCVVGGGHYGRFLPYVVEEGTIPLISLTFQMPCFGCSWTCIYPERPVRCVAQVSVDDVLESCCH